MFAELITEFIVKRRQGFEKCLIKIEKAVQDLFFYSWFFKTYVACLPEFLHLYKNIFFYYLFFPLCPDRIFVLKYRKVYLPVFFKHCPPLYFCGMRCKNCCD